MLPCEQSVARSLPSFSSESSLWGYRLEEFLTHLCIGLVGVPGTRTLHLCCCIVLGFIQLILALHISFYFRMQTTISGFSRSAICFGMGSSNRSKMVKFQVPNQYYYCGGGIAQCQKHIRFVKWDPEFQPHHSIYVVCTAGGSRAQYREKLPLVSPEC